MPLLFIDLETTGLDPNTCAVLEVAAVVVPDNLELNDAAPRFHAVLAYDTAWCKFLDPVVVEMHTKNGLWAKCENLRLENYEPERPYSIENIDDRFRDFIRTHCPGAQLAGNSVHFDRAFMGVHLPRSLAELHYRQLDVSSINELARRVWPDVYAARPTADDKPHRALPDVYNSIAQARHYAAALGPIASIPEGM